MNDIYREIWERMRASDTAYTEPKQLIHSTPGVRGVMADLWELPEEPTLIRCPYCQQATCVDTSKSIVNQHKAFLGYLNQCRFCKKDKIFFAKSYYQKERLVAKKKSRERRNKSW
jgi:hypothetical protein